MYPSIPSDDYQKSPIPPSAPPTYSQPAAAATGFPVNNTNYYNPNAVAAPGVWSTGLCGCCDDVSNCCVTCWCPCITFGQIAEIVDKGATTCGTAGALYALIALVTGCSCLYSCSYRSKLRGQYRLPESPCGDCLVHCCCETCALCQEYRELKHRGFDLSIGWQANVQRQNQGVAMAPVIQPGMNR